MPSEISANTPTTRAPRATAAAIGGAPNVRELAG